MIDSFPFDEWSEDIAGFWTFGPGNSTGTYIMTALGIIVMVGAWIAWFWVEHRKLTRQAEHLRAAGLLPAPGGGYPGTGPTQPPMAGPSTDPGP
ncbi:MAG TPA: hypothetical protein VFR63_14615 [Gaiellaceae bacterium]|jgi:hypothetical protein|nr:hypothetical protein [Gaiellaceae bacterium]